MECIHSSTMRSLARGCFATLLLLAGVVSPGVAQWHDAAVGYGAGFASFSSFTEGGQELSLDAGWIATLQAERWYFGRRVGFRVNGAFTQRPLDVGETPRDIDTWMLDGDLMLRLLPATEGRNVAPFLMAGAGVIFYELGTGPQLSVNDGNAVYPGDSERQFAVAGGIGFDILPGGLVILGTPIGFRLEAADHIALESPFRGADGAEFGPIHNIRVTLSAIGLEELLW